MNNTVRINRAPASVYVAMLGALALAACQQAPAPANQASQAAAEREAEAAKAKPVSGTDKLVISVDGDKNPSSNGAWVHVRVMQAGNSVAPSDGACNEADCNPGKGFSQTDPGVYVYSFTPVAGPKSVTFTLDKNAAPALAFSTTDVSGKVKVSWQGIEKVYDLYQPASNTTQHPPIRLDQPLPEAY